MSSAVHHEVAIVVLTCNQRDVTLACLASLAEAPDVRDAAIVVVDNGSTDGTYQVLRDQPALTYLRNETNLGCSTGRNAAIQRLSGNGHRPEFVLFLDNDTRVTPGFLSRMVEALRSDTAAGLASCKIYKLGTDRMFDAAGGMHVNLFTGQVSVRGHGKRDRGQFDTPDYVDAFGTSCLLCRWEVIEQLEGFDPGFDPYGFEDFDFCLRARKLGYRIRYVPEAVIYHQESRTPGGGLYGVAYAYLKGRNLRRLLAKHGGLHHKLGFYGCFGPGQGLASVLREILRGNARAGFALVHGFLRAGRPSKVPR